jgi:ABC-type cobalamin/Fe3+-siderophores transport system ATPase subunit
MLRIITLQDISLQRRPQRLLDNTSGTIQTMSLAIIIDANGCGKSCLFKLMPHMTQRINKELTRGINKTPILIMTLLMSKN